MVSHQRHTGYCLAIQRKDREDKAKEKERQENLSKEAREATIRREAERHREESLKEGRLAQERIRELELALAQQAGASEAAMNICAFKQQVPDEAHTNPVVPNQSDVFNCQLRIGNDTILQIPMRGDGYVNATALCKAGGKLFNDYSRCKQTQAYVQALEQNTGIPVLRLIESKKGKNGGTWVHPQVATHLAQWISPEFAVQVNKWVFDLLTTGKADVKPEEISITTGPEELYDKQLSLDYTPYFGKDVLYIGVFDPVTENLEGEIPEGQRCYKFGVTHNVKSRINAHRRYLEKFRLVYLLDCGHGTGRSYAEKRVKELIEDRGVGLKYNGHKEMFRASQEQYEEIVERIGEMQLSPVDDPCEKSGNRYESRRMELEFEDRLHEREQETKRMEQETTRMELEHVTRRVEAEVEARLAEARIEEKRQDIEMLRLRMELGLSVS